MIIAFASFIYNEIIVCNFYRLNENTWKAIDRKALKDMYLEDTRDSMVFCENYKIDEIIEPSDENSTIEMANY